MNIFSFVECCNKLQHFTKENQSYDEISSYNFPCYANLLVGRGTDALIGKCKLDRKKKQIAMIICVWPEVLHVNSAKSVYHICFPNHFVEPVFDSGIFGPPVFRAAMATKLWIVIIQLSFFISFIKVSICMTYVIELIAISCPSFHNFCTCL